MDCVLAADTRHAIDHDLLAASEARLNRTVP
jgi:hypothetical protein